MNIMYSSSYTIKHNYFLVHDHPQQDPLVLEALFKDAYLLFKMRIEKLGNVHQLTTREESEIMRIMLESLITAKNQIHQSHH